MDSSQPIFEILVVDDSAVYRKQIDQILAYHPSYKPLLACNGTEALNIYREKVPSIVVTDWMMPDFSGIELCQRIRAEKSQPYAYVIMMTSNTDRGRVAQALEAGADDYIAKPFDGSEMLARIGAGRRAVELYRELEGKNAKLEELARTDALTGLPNRRAIEEWADKQLEGSSRHGFPIWIVLSDLDAFKEINDTFGHAAGDAVLRAFAETLKKGTRASDMCGRLAGDEFVIVITHVSAENIELAVNRFREQFSRLWFPFAGHSISLTATFGVAGTEWGKQKSFAELLRSADEMLYEAKRGGRNRVRVRKLENALLEPLGTEKGTLNTGPTSRKEC
jgi:diguanylate cyclase (GGDEF)-like protein